MTVEQITHSVAFVAVVAVAGLMFMGYRGTIRKIDYLRSRGLYPEEGKGTDEDVRKLVELGERIPAVRLYREIHEADLGTAMKAVERMRRGE